MLFLRLFLELGWKAHQRHLLVENINAL
uniref:Uncharacterized protein n=1 Tax=Anguilla anguilla TaxID=7936 RepID=A0A0E9Q821_ANGAN